MLHFIIEITYTATLPEIDRVLPAHRAFLQTGYDCGLLLLSGPQNPRTGGVLVARAASRAELEAFLRDDPYQAQGNHLRDRVAQSDTSTIQNMVPSMCGS